MGTTLGFQDKKKFPGKGLVWRVISLRENHKLEWIKEDLKWLKQPRQVLFFLLFVLYFSLIWGITKVGGKV